MTRRSTGMFLYLGCGLAVLIVSAYRMAPSAPVPVSADAARSGQSRQEQILLGRAIVVSHDCGGCHGGNSDPASAHWLDGMRDTLQQFRLGPFIVRPKNLTPDVATGTGGLTERQIFNALRYGLRPEETPDVQITSTVPGQGNFPLHPHYLAPIMPWSAWRNMSDAELYAVAAYLKDGLKPVKNKVEDSDGPPDFWASESTPEKLGTYPTPAFPTANEKGGR